MGLTDTELRGLAECLIRAAHLEWNLPSQVDQLAKVLKDEVGRRWWGSCGPYGLMVMTSPKGCKVESLTTKQGRSFTWREAARLILDMRGSSSQPTLF